jgi:chaperonin cofactor prefoldin
MSQRLNQIQNTCPIYDKIVAECKEVERYLDNNLTDTEIMWIKQSLGEIESLADDIQNTAGDLRDTASDIADSKNEEIEELEARVQELESELDQLKSEEVC